MTVTNDGSAEASDVLVRFYAGDPSQGGTQIGETTIDGPIGSGDSESVTVTLDAQSRNITLWAVVDPLNTIAECNDGNNRDKGPDLNCDTQTRAAVTAHCSLKPPRAVTIGAGGVDA